MIDPKFVEQAKKLNPKYISMIIPSRWFTGGRGLDEFREEMLCDKRICNITDYPNPYDCFQGVDIAGGICYFLWNNSYNGLCEFNSIIGEECHSVTRKLDEYPIFIRDAIGLEIIRKVSKFALKNLSDTVSSQTPYGIITSYKPTEFGTPCWFRQKIGLKYVKSSDVRDLYHNIDKYKVLIPEAPIAGQTDFTKPVGLYYPGNTIIANPGEICSQTLLVANSFNTLEEAESFKSYLHTKTVRFLILQTVVSQHVSREKFCFVPNFDNYNGSYTDKQLCEMWNITEDEWNYIDSRIHNYGADDIDNED